ncbi:hypothetical protein K431DRAFT_283482 [Polychaeton citri CBS 116435]|uniref:Apple domain-containing protein n=1 Tax=Polychaeton citri CBS 116435 TaxID=1314669 RepID=A0A9P4QDS3_9PEZI|nr:hypothetical protein K431DRAFT_283482 [Polychaeton citri CBS 116435]
MARRFLLASLAVAATSVSASPIVAAPSPPGFCKAISAAVSKVKALSTATPFCSSFLHIPTVTSTKVVTSTSVIPTTTIVTTGTNTVTASTVIVLTTSQSTTIVTATATNVVTVVSGTDTITADPTTITLTDYTTVIAPTCTSANAKRDPALQAVPPALQSLASSAISSACSCLAIPTPTVSVTTTSIKPSTSVATVKTAAAATTTPSTTSTSISAVIQTTTITITSQSSIADATTVTPTTTTTTTEESTTTLQCAATPTCSAASNAQGGFYTLYYTGSGYTENYNNPGNDNTGFPPLVNYFPASTSTCDAVTQCASISYADPYVYWSFDLHFRTSTNQWECVQFFDNSQDPGYFNVADPDVSVAYGYSL